MNIDTQQLTALLKELLTEPTANPMGSLLLLAVLTTVVLIIVIIAILFIMGGDDSEYEEDDYYYEDEVPKSTRAASTAGGATASATAAQQAQLPTAKRRGVAGFLGFWALVLLLMWVVGGAVTSQRALCVSCHPGNPHAQSADKDPHVKAECVSCHEPGGPVAAVTYQVPSRGIHFVTGILRPKQARGYGDFVASSECARCHEDSLNKTITIESQGVRVSHKEPLEAGAECIDCHALNSGVVSNLTVGMSTCLKCHDGKTAKSECKSCHTKDIGAAVRPNEMATPLRAKDLIEQVDCGGCHSQKTCDSCHGLRLPHTREFMAFGHAREGVESIWNDGGKTCSKCHYESRRPCTRCHKGFPSHPLTWKTDHQYGSPKGCSNSCHVTKSYVAGRNLCSLCHEAGKQPRKPPVVAPLSEPPQ